MEEILQFLKTQGEQLDSEIAAATGKPIEKVRAVLTELHSKGDVTTCRSIRFKDGEKTEATLYRIATFIPPASRGRKPKAQRDIK
jgi:transcription initiation factor IIE alpha subunit